MPRKLTQKVFVLTIIFLVSIAVTATAAWNAIDQLRKSAHHVTNEVIGQVQVSASFDLHISRANSELQAYTLGGDQADLDLARQNLGFANEQLATIKELTSHESEHSAETAAAYSTLLTQRQELIDHMQVVFDTISSSSGGHLNAPGTKEELEKIEHDSDSINKVTLELLHNELAETTALVSGGIDWTRMSITGIAGFAAGLMVIGLLLVQLIIVRPVSSLSTAAEAVIAGNHAVQVAVTSQDEIGTLQHAFNSMISTLAQQQQDLREQVTNANEARSTAEEARATIAEQLDTILQQRALIREMDIPVIPVSDATLVIPLVGNLDHERINNLAQRALAAVAKQHVRLLALDVTGTMIFDEVVARGLVEVVQSVRLLGAEAILVGVRPELAQTIIQLGFDLSGMRTFSTLQSALTLGVRGPGSGIWSAAA
jgi:rsbT co-antagonist protein RsbR